MIMRYLEERVKVGNIQKSSLPPDWASERNSSLRAWQFVEGLKKEKLLYIKAHNKITHFGKQQTYQIKASEVAKALGLNRSTLMHRSSYSASFAAYLNKINSELDTEKTKKIDAAKENSSRGPIQTNKEQLQIVNSELKKQLDNLKTQKLEELVKLAFDQLPLPIKKKLGIF